MEKIEYYTLRPSLKQYFGRKVTKELEFDETTKNGKVHQILKELILTTEIEDERTLKLKVNGEEKELKTIEKSKLIQEVAEGIILIWDEENGYIIPNYEFCTLNEVEKDLTDMKSVYDNLKEE